MKRSYSNTLQLTVTVGILLLLMMGNTLSVSANAAQVSFSGVDHTGAVLLESESPLVVEHELLTFDIQTFPPLFASAEEAEAYTAQVTAEYTLYNPSDYTVTTKLLFPFDHYPSYMDREIIGGKETDTEKYHVMLGGQMVEVRLRHTLLAEELTSFDWKAELFAWSDTERNHPFYHPALSVTRYTYTVQGIGEDYPAATAAFDLPPDDGSRKYLLPTQCGRATQDNGMVRISVDTENGQNIVLYVIGEARRHPIQWTVYQNGGIETGEEIEGQVTLTDTHRITFRELTLMGRPKVSSVLPVDWYNAMVADFDRNEDECGVVACSAYHFDLSHLLMRWYSYEITLAPKERVLHAVTAPLYPSIRTDRNPAIYRYTYLLSPAQSWSKFGSLDIVLATPFFLPEENDGWQKTEQGYQKHCDTLPREELVFTLSETPNPIQPMSDNGNAPSVIRCFWIVAVIVSVLDILVLLLIWILRKRKNHR